LNNPDYNTANQMITEYNVSCVSQHVNHIAIISRLYDRG